MRNFDLSPLYRSAIGFDRLFNLIESGQNQGGGYPPYNVEQVGEAAVRISLAVAGFAPEELAITLEGRQLTIAGKRDDAGKGEQAFLHRGIAARGFVRSFVLADGLEVAEARLEHGLLHVDLVRPEQERQIRRIPITTG